MNSFGEEVVLSFVDQKNKFLLVIDFKMNVDPILWMKEHSVLINSMLVNHGVVYLKGIGFTQSNVVSAVSSILPTGALVNSYSGGVIGRPKVDQNLFLTTTAPPSAGILQHHEMSYMSSPPKKIFFYCNIPAEHGGATPVAFSPTIKDKLNPKIFSQFKNRGIRYVRNYYPNVSPDWVVLLSWQKAFEVNTKAEFEKKAKSLGFSYSWNGDILRTENRCSATIRHSVTNEEFLFNHSFVLHSTENVGPKNPASRGMDHTMSESEIKLVSQLSSLELPYYCSWGDTGEKIEPDIIEEVFQCYNLNKYSVTWRTGDLMLIDNIMASHGRDPFLGKREVLAMISKF